ncbi:helix-turn-helix domain-containing protein [Methylobacterium oryzisoli]|uniref:helix-turn-helix domain-containing protein n=1 Tax=Methylobacterium oryzisoli TaxID=3385502 RepID=UPI00389264DB
MASIVRPSSSWYGHGQPPTLLNCYEEPGWNFLDLNYSQSGSWDVVSSSLHVAYHFDPHRQRSGPARSPLLPTAPSAAISAPGDHLVGAWEGITRGQHLMISADFVTAALERDLNPDTILTRHFASRREPDAKDAIVQNLLNALSINLSSGNPSGSVFMQTVLVAILHHVLHPSKSIGAISDQRKGLSARQLSMVLELIDAQLLERPSLIDLAASLNVSTGYFCRAFRISTGLPPHQFIIKRRVELARAMIEEGTLSLSDVARAAGFKDHSQMSATFKKVTGSKPSQFRRN